MAPVKRGKSWFGEAQADIRVELARYSGHGYPAQHFANAVCACSSSAFRLQLDDNTGVAVRICTACGIE